MSDDIIPQVAPEPAAPVNVAVEAVKTDLAAPSNDFSSFLNSVPEELRSDPSLSSVKDGATLIKNYINAQKMIGNSVRIPRNDDPQELKDSFFAKLKDVPGIVKLPNKDNQEEMNGFLTALGRPIKSEDYKFEATKDAVINEDILKSFKDVAYKSGLTQNQAKAMVDFQSAVEKQVISQNQAEVDATHALLAKEWGAEKDNRLNAINDLIKTYEAKFPDAAKSLLDNRVMNNPVVLMMAAELSKVYHEQGIISSEKSGVTWGLTPDEAREKIKAVRENPDLMKAYLDDRHPQHKAIVDKMQQYYNASHS